MITLPILDIFSDFAFIIQIFILLTLMSFVFQHYGKNGWSYVLILILGYLVFFVIPGLSFGIFLLQLLLTAGISSIIVDFFFVTQSHGAMQKGKTKMGQGTQHQQQAAAEGQEPESMHQPQSGGGHGGAGGLVQALFKRGGH